MRQGMLGLVGALLLAPSMLAGASAPALGADASLLTLTAVSGRAFTPDGDGIQDRFEGALTLAAPAFLSADVLTWEGAGVAILLASVELPPGTYPVIWDGVGAANGIYRIRASATAAGGSTVVQELQVARVRALAYPTNPSSVLIFLDPGHGGDAPGGAFARLPDATLIREKDLNLDIGLKLGAMLRASGIRVSMSRTTDVAPNAARLDRDGNRKIDGYDDFLARMDAANRARADAFIAIHNNFIPEGKSGTGRTEAFYCGVGCSSPASSRSLAALVLQEHVDALAPFQTEAWHLTLGDPAIPEADRNPTDDYRRFAYATWPPGRHFYYLGPYAPPFRPRALQMPAILAESLALSDPTELAMLATPSVRTLLATAYYDGIVRWLAGRTAALRIDPVSLPSGARVGRMSFVDVRLTNNGNEPLPAGTPLLVGSVAPAAVYDGSPNPGAKIGSTRIREALPPGASTVVRIAVKPTSAGDAIWKVDAVLNGSRTSTQRVPFLQWRVRVGR